MRRFEKKFEKTLKKQLKQEAPKIPAQTEAALDGIIKEIKTEHLKRRSEWFRQPKVLVRFGAAVSMVIFVLLFLNFKMGSPDEQSKVFTELDTGKENVAGSKETAIEPQIEEMESIRVGMTDCRNPEVRQFIDMILTQFKRDRNENGKKTDADYQIVTDTERWFALRMTVPDEKGDEVYYYNVDKENCCIVRLQDIFVAEFDYVEVLSGEIREQMRAEAGKREEKTYDWAEGEENKIDRNQEFYFNQKGNLVIVFGKGEAVPEEMGYQRFVIEREVFEKALK